MSTRRESHTYQTWCQYTCRRPSTVQKKNYAVCTLLREWWQIMGPRKGVQAADQLDESQLYPTMMHAAHAFERPWQAQKLAGEPTWMMTPFRRASISFMKAWLVL